MKEKLLYSIYNCHEMDGDFRLTDSELGGIGTDFTQNIVDDEPPSPPNF